MYRLRFKGDDGPYVRSNKGLWVRAGSADDIVGPVMLVSNHKCVADDGGALKLQSFAGEPASASQVWDASWIESSLLLKSSDGLYLENRKGEWAAKSHAVSGPQGKFKLFQDQDLWSLKADSTLTVEGVEKFIIFVQDQPQQPPAVPTIAELERMVGRSLSEQEIEKLYRAKEQGNLHETVASWRDSTVNDRRI